MIAGVPPIPTPPATYLLPFLVLDLEPLVAGLPQGINLKDMLKKISYPFVMKASQAKCTDMEMVRTSEK